LAKKEAKRALQCVPFFVIKQPFVVVVNTNHHYGKQGGELKRNCIISVPDPLFLPTQYKKKK